MKKLSILVVALLVANLGFCQTNVGIKAGYTNSGLSNLEDDEFGEFKRGGGLLVGVIGQFGITENLSVVAEANLHQKSQKSEGSFDFFGISTTFESTTTINYLEIPVLLRFTTGEDLMFFGNVGPSFGYALGGKAKGETTVAGETTSTDGKIKFDTEPENYMGDDIYVDGFNRVEVGVSIGAGIQKAVGPGSLVVEARYGLGLTDTNDIENEPDGYDPNKFNSISVSVGFMIPIGGN